MIALMCKNVLVSYPVLRNKSKVFLFWKKLSQKAFVVYSLLLLRISKHEMSQLTIIQGEIFG